MTTFARTDTSLLGRWWWTVDRWTLGALLSLVAVGLVLTMAASPAVAERIGLDAFHFARRQVAYVPLEEMTAIEGFDADIATELRARAKDALLTQAIASEEQLGAREPAEDLLTMDGMDRHLAYILASREFVTMEDLAEQGVDDLMDIPDMTEERAGELIMTARAPWFAEAEAE